MSRTERHKRLRLLINKLNKHRKQQAKKIDILCNDLIGAQRAFLDRLQTIAFAAEFYRSLLGAADLDDLLTRASRAIEQELPGVGVTFFLRQPEGCDVYAIEGNAERLPECHRPEQFLSADLVDSICKSDRTCTLDDLYDLDSDLGSLAEFSLATVPLSHFGRSLGFMLLYRRSPQTLAAADLRRIGPVMCGLSQAVRSARVPLTSRD